MLKFTEEDKKVREFTESLPFGISEVQITGVVADTTEAGKDYIEIGVVNKEGVEDSFRLWFVGKATNIAFNNARDIAVHSAKDEEQKERARQAIDACADAMELATILATKCTGTQIWFTKYYDPTRTYQDGQGKTRRSVNKNGYAYEPKLKPELMPKPEGGDEITKDNVDKFFDDMGDGKKADGATTIPDKW